MFHLDIHTKVMNMKENEFDELWDYVEKHNNPTISDIYVKFNSMLYFWGIKEVVIFGNNLSNNVKSMIESSEYPGIKHTYHANIPGHIMISDQDKTYIIVWLMISDILYIKSELINKKT